MSYFYQITGIPLSNDPTEVLVTAILTDDSGGQTLGRNYTLPIANNPQASDFQTIIQADVDALNAAQDIQTALAQDLTSQTVIPVDNTAVTASVGSINRIASVKTSASSQKAS